MTHDHLPDGYYWAESLATFERDILLVKDGYLTVVAAPRRRSEE